MIRFSGISYFCSAILSVGVAVSFAQEIDPEPFSQDQFSGRTVQNLEMAKDLVLNRFYNAPRYGSMAPNFALVDAETGETLTLTDLRKEKPVVLFFGSYGCDVFRAGFDELLAVYEKYKDEVNFVMVYVREAHTLNGFGADRARVVDPRSTEERLRVARRCRDEMKIPFRVLVDPVDDRVATRWASWPIRLYVIDRGGTVVYSGRPGPWGFSPGGGFKAQHADEILPHPDRFSQDSLEDFLAEYVKKGE